VRGAVPSTWALPHGRTPATTTEAPLARCEGTAMPANLLNIHLANANVADRRRSARRGKRS